jgi:hypothetical protein
MSTPETGPIWSSAPGVSARSRCALPAGPAVGAGPGQVNRVGARDVRKYEKSLRAELRQPAGRPGKLGVWYRAAGLGTRS